MKFIKTGRRFGSVTHPEYLRPHENKPIIAESSAIGDYEDSFERPGTSFLWIGEHHHLNREEVRELVDTMNHWLDTGRLSV